MTPGQCPGCGAAVKAAPDATSYQCPYCQHRLSLSPRPPSAPPASSSDAARIIVVHHDSGGSAFAGYWGTRLAVLLVLVVLSMGGWGVRRWRAGSTMARVAASIAWDGSTPLTCGGNDELEVEGVTATFAMGSAIVATGNCHVTCRSCALNAPVAVRADGNGQVTLVNGSVTGADASLAASGNGTINVTGNAQVVGPTRQSGNGTVNGVAPASASRAVVPASPQAPHAAAVPHAAKKR